MTRRAPEPDPMALWRSMKQLVVRLVESIDHEQFLDECLDAVLAQLGADCALIVLAEADGATYTVSARTQQRPMTADEQEKVSRTVIRRALESGECVTWDALEESEATESLLALDIGVALAAPLRNVACGDSSRRDPCGALYLDFRNVDARPEAIHKEFFEAVAAIVSAALEQNQKLQIAREGLREGSAPRGMLLAPLLQEMMHAPGMESLRVDVEACVQSDAPVLIVGESGSGKTLLAHAIAEASGRKPIVRAVLGSSDDLNTITSELFGHERGSFSGAVARRAGMVEFADGGTLVLDEILNMPLHAQQLLLDFTQFGTYRPLGYSRPEPKRAHVRLIALTSGDLEKAVAERRFREDLFYRIAGVRLRVPSLRERRRDISSIAEAYLRRLDPDRTWHLALPLRRLLVSDDIDWPGNVRQLEQALRRARDRALSRDPHATVLTLAEMDLRDLRTNARTSAPPPGLDTSDLTTSWATLQSERSRLDRVEAELIERGLVKHNGVLAYAARELGVARTTLASRVESLGIARARRVRS